ncbi:phosphoribosylanthranilate isomerase [Metabacillus idriensis]|uniref:phosphoribosylanthranilate isomerase n=1 Tax=Metabacillus idriensis TaxID=324768 RepID=UPI0028140F2B|nr:phosphoribosylanthranilate isomerase [Metabacillus idriensis]MDR0139796.1 phosphoribosylanthranilate isomerase [Metabacillus idriensis]
MSKPLIKLCGNHSLEDLKLTSKSDADYLGLIFAESKRIVEALDVKEWLKEVETEDKQLVAVFVNARLDEIEQVMNELPIDVIQCHGSETVKEIAEIKHHFKREVWKALPHYEGTLSDMKLYAEAADGFVIDSKVKDAFGGTGRTFDWSKVPCYIQAAEAINKTLFIAGGLTPDNIEQLLGLHPPGIDISSGIEQYGKKDEALLTRLEERVNHHVSVSR